MKLINLFTPNTVIKLIGLWPPYFFSGISVESVNEDLTEIVVSMKQRPWNTNYVGTHFGGSLYSMCDPFFMFILLHHLGRDHIVWDKAASIQFVRPGKGTVTACFHIHKQTIDQIREQAANEYKVEPIFEAEVVDKNGDIVSKIEKTLYVRRKDSKKNRLNK